MQEAAACCRDLPIIVGSSRSSNSSTSYVASYFACIALIRDFCFFKKLCSLLLCLHSSSILFVTFLQMSICTQRPNEEALQYPPSTCPASLSETFFLFHSCKSQVTPWLASLVDKPFCFVLFVNLKRAVQNMYVVKWRRRVVDGVEGGYGMLGRGERGAELVHVLCMPGKRGRRTTGFSFSNLVVHLCCCQGRY